MSDVIVIVMVNDCSNEGIDLNPALHPSMGCICGTQDGHPVLSKQPVLAPFPSVPWSSSSLLPPLPPEPTSPTTKIEVSIVTDVASSISLSPSSALTLSASPSLTLSASPSSFSTPTQTPTISPSSASAIETVTPTYGTDMGNAVDTNTSINTTVDHIAS